MSVLRSSIFVDTWIESFRWTTFIMSFFGLPLTFIWWGWECPPEYMFLLVLSVKIAFVGSVYYPCATLIYWNMGGYLKLIEWNNVLGASIVAVLFGNWLGNEFYSDGAFIIAVIAPAFAGLVTHLRLQIEVAR